MSILSARLRVNQNLGRWQQVEGKNADVARAGSFLQVSATTVVFCGRRNTLPQRLAETPGTAFSLSLGTKALAGPRPLGRLWGSFLLPQVPGSEGSLRLWLRHSRLCLLLHPAFSLRLSLRPNVPPLKTAVVFQATLHFVPLVGPSACPPSLLSAPGCCSALVYRTPAHCSRGPWSSTPSTSCPFIVMCVSPLGLLYLRATHWETSEKFILSQFRS